MISLITDGTTTTLTCDGLLPDHPYDVHFRLADRTREQAGEGLWAITTGVSGNFAADADGVFVITVDLQHLATWRLDKWSLQDHDEITGWVTEQGRYTGKGVTTADGSEAKATETLNAPA